MSDTNATIGGPLLSASSVTTRISGGGIKSKQVMAVSGTLEAVGRIGSVIKMVCSTFIELPQESVTE